MESKSSFSVQDYLDARLFLQDFYRLQKSKDPLFSYESWARALGINSKSYLRFVVLGKRKISPELTQKMIQFMGLSESESDYFSLLVLYTQSEEPQQKKILGRRLVEQLKKNVNTEEILPPPSLLSNPIQLVVRNLLSFADSPGTMDFLKKTLQLEEAELIAILQQLESAGLIRRNQEKWIANHQLIKIPNQTKQETQLYHRLVLDKAIEAQRLPLSERNFRSIGIALSEDEYAEYLKDLEAFIQNTFAKFDTNLLTSKRFYQINFNLFPWTERMNESTLKNSPRLSSQNHPSPCDPL